MYLIPQFFLILFSAEYVIKSKRRNSDRISEEFVCLFNFTKDRVAIQNFFDNLSLRVKVVIIDNIDPESDYFKNDIKSKMISIPNMIFLCVTTQKVQCEVNIKKKTYFSFFFLPFFILCLIIIFFNPTGKKCPITFSKRKARKQLFGLLTTQKGFIN